MTVNDLRVAFEKYRAIEVDSKKRRYLHIAVEGSVCYLAYFKVGERGWFLYEDDDPFSPPHRIHTSEVQEVNLIIDNEDTIVEVITENTTYKFKQIQSEDDV